MLGILVVLQLSEALKVLCDVLLHALYGKGLLANTDHKAWLPCSLPR